MRAERARRGSAAMEFVLWMPIICLLLFGLVDAGLYTASQHDLARAAHDGARIGAGTSEAIEPPTGDVIEAAAVDAAQKSLAAAGIDDATVTATWWTDEYGLSFVTVEVSRTYRSIGTGLTPFGGPQDHAFTMMTQEQ